VILDSEAVGTMANVAAIAKNSIPLPCLKASTVSTLPYSR
jgi:hypothetical protein